MYFELFLKLKTSKFGYKIINIGERARTSKIYLCKVRKIASDFQNSYK